MNTEDGGSALKCSVVQHLCLRQGFFWGDVQQAVDHAFAGYTDKYGPSQGGEAVQMGEQLIILLYDWQSDCMVCGLPRLCIATYSSPSLPTAGSI